MQSPEHRKPNSPGTAKSAVKALTLRLDRAAGDLNPFLMVLAVGLVVLNLTLYIGMAVASQPPSWMAPHQAGARAASTPEAPPAADFGR